MSLKDVLLKISGKCTGCLLAITLLLSSTFSQAQTYTSVYNSINYSSTRPYNLNIVYFVPNDVTLDPTYKKRLSELMLYAQNFYKQNMINNGYGAKTFGLFTETAHPDSVKIILINGTQPSSAYTYDNPDQLALEVNDYFTNNPIQKTSKHILIITAIPDINTANVPFYGMGTSCYALDYPQLDIQYMGGTGPWADKFIGWYGGMVHELGHGLNVYHSHQTNSEDADPNKGMNLMSAGNSTLGQSPTFINRADCAILSNCQVFAITPGTTYYNGHNSYLTSLKATFSNGNLIVSGKYSSDRLVTDINIYQDPHATPSEGYDRVAWSVPPIGSDSFYVSMPVSELQVTNTPTVLEIELVLQNGETSETHYPFIYNNGVPAINVDFDDNAPCANPYQTGWQLSQIGGSDAGIACYTTATGNVRIKSFDQLSDTEDHVPFLNTVLTGDGSIIARVKNVSSVPNNSGGIMMRNNLAGNSSYVSLSALDATGVFDISRSADGVSSSYHDATELPIPMWLKLQRTGNTITSFYSEDGVNWTSYHDHAVTLGNSIYVGIMASGSSTIANIDQISVINAPLSIADHTAAETVLTCYPNPAQNELQVKLSGGQVIKTITIYDINDRKVMEQKSSPSANIKIGHLPDGIYMIEATTRNGQSFRKKINKV